MGGYERRGKRGESSSFQKGFAFEEESVRKEGERVLNPRKLRLEKKN